MVTLSINLIHV